LVNDADVDVIYVATPHPFHKEHSLLALNAGKAVLCEKPVTINAHDLQEMVDTPAPKTVFLLEGHWSRFFPLDGPRARTARGGRYRGTAPGRVQFRLPGGRNPKAACSSPNSAAARS
jgi:hypothetical protein